MQITNINNHLNLQTYNNVKKIVEDEHQQNSALQTFYEEHENYELPPFFIYNKYSKNLKASKRKILWSSEKIMETTELALDKFSTLINKNEVSLKSINNILFELLPNDIAENIKFSDYKTDFANHIKAKNKWNDKETNNFVKRYKAFASGDDNGRTLIFIPISDIYKSEYDKVMCKNFFAHELKHALTANLTDTEENDLIKIGSDSLAKKYNTFFKELEQTYDFVFEDNKDKLIKTELSKDNFIKNIVNVNTKQGFNTEEEFIEDFENELIFMLNNLDLTHNTLYSKAFCEYISHYATDEKEAYTFQKVLRELNSDIESPVKIELRQVKYDFIERYFRQKADASEF